MLATAVRAGVVMLTGLWAGVLFGDWRGATLVRPGLPDACFVQFQQGLHDAYVPMMPILILSSGAICVFAAWQMRAANRAAAMLFGIAAFGILSVAVLTAAVNAPINEALMTWDPANPPADMRQTWHRWELGHSVRTPIAIVAFGLQCIALSLLSLGAKASGASRPAA